MTPRLKGALIALVGTTAWATTGIFISYLLNHYSLAPLTLAFWRDLIVALTLLIGLAFIQPSALRIERRDILFFLAYGSVGLAVFNGLWTYSVRFNGAAVATVLVYCAPGFTALLAPWLLREPLTHRKLLAVALSFGGCVLVANAYTVAAWRVNPIGIVVGLGTGLASAVYSLAGRWSSKRFASSWTVTTYGFLFAAGALALTQIGQNPFSLGSAVDGWLILAALAIGPSVLGFGLYTLSLRYLQASVAMLIAALEPAFTAIMAVLLLAERMAAPQWLGAALVLTAALLAQGEPQEIVSSPAVGD